MLLRSIKSPKRAQVAIEGILAWGIIFLIFLGVYSFYIDKNDDLIQLEDKIKEHEDCLQIANLITGTLLLNDGTRLNLQLHTNISIYPEQQKIEVSEESCTVQINTISNSESLSQEEFSLSEGTVLIRNYQGWVIVENV